MDCGRLGDELSEVKKDRKSERGEERYKVLEKERGKCEELEKHSETVLTLK